MKSKNTKQVEKMWTAQDEEMLSYCSGYLDEKQIEWLESIKQRLSAQTDRITRTF